MAEKKDEKAEGKKLPIALILQALFAVVNLGVTGLGAYWVYSATIGWHLPEITEQSLAAQKAAEEQRLAAAGGETGPLVYTMDKFTVNLAGEPKRAIRIEVNLEMLGKEGFEEIINSDNRAKARDSIVRILNDKTFGDLESIQGKLFLKDRISTDVNALLDRGVVKDVYFSEFVVQ
ncbi:MAG: flagellar basal body-associated FliL family protein [Pseudobdellovibrionaceae bacterium]